MNSWQTTILGIVSILAAVFGALQLVLDSDPSTNPDWNVVIAAVVAGLGLIRARDNDKRSETVGAK